MNYLWNSVLCQFAWLSSILVEIAHQLPYSTVECMLCQFLLNSIFVMTKSTMIGRKQFLKCAIVNIVNMNPLDKTNKAKQIRTYFTGNWLLLVHTTYLSGSYIWINLTLLIHSQRTMKPTI